MDNDVLQERVAAAVHARCKYCKKMYVDCTCNSWWVFSVFGDCKLMSCIKRYLLFLCSGEERQVIIYMHKERKPDFLGLCLRAKLCDS